MPRLLLACLAVLLLAPLLRADRPADLAAEVREMWLERDPAKRMALAVRLTSGPASAREMAKAVEEAERTLWDKDAAKGEAVVWTATTPDGVEHEVFAYAPPAYSPERAWPLLVWMHGAVSRTEPGRGAHGIELLREKADAKGFLVLSPSARLGSEWWGPNGVKLLRDALAEMKLRYRVDADRVCAAGFSDGGSGCFHLVAHDPDPYCCFLSFVGHPLTSRMRGGPTWAESLASRPVYAVNGVKDTLFPARVVQPFFMDMKDAGLDLHWRAEEELGHEWPLFEQNWEEAYEFWMAHPRDPAPKKLAWTTSRPGAEGRLAWIEIVELEKTAHRADGLARATELALPDMRRPRLGIRMSREHEGEGLYIEEVEDGTPAADAGFEDGDVILKAGEVTFAGSDDLPNLPRYLRGLQGEEGVFLVKRGDETLEIRAAPKILEKDRPPRPEALGYDVEPATVVAELKPDNRIEVRSVGVGRYDLHLSADLFDLSQPVRVLQNGLQTLVFDPADHFDAAYVLAQALRQGPGAPVAVLRIPVVVPRPKE